MNSCVAAGQQEAPCGAPQVFLTPSTQHRIAAARSGTADAGATKHRSILIAACAQHSVAPRSITQYTLVVDKTGILMGAAEGVLREGREQAGNRLLPQ